MKIKLVETRQINEMGMQHGGNGGYRIKDSDGKVMAYHKWLGCNRIEEAPSVANYRIACLLNAAAEWAGDVYAELDSLIHRNTPQYLIDFFETISMDDRMESEFLTAKDNLQQRVANE